ncbi:hypothetical protein RJ639_037851 [Escallonia herrerae]|uniref:Dirigent protein n=1 Tax=Escallonia herrerae TaxID=1293975 RepID=A0AA88WIU3_9ASTE|nr:hypothetical protein RJ639_037851 [Escallonia herrerae]
MARLGMVAMLIFLETTMLWAQSPEEGSSSWATRDDSGDEVVTNLKFYFHDTLSGKSPSAVRVAQASDTDKSPTLFGALMMVDDPLTEGPDMSSKHVGRARGIYGSAGQTDLGLIMALDYGFTDGIYSGSSFSVLGINPAMQHVRELPIISGTGLFRMGRGYAIAQTYSFDPKTGDAVVGYNVTIVTYKEIEALETMEKLSQLGFERLMKETELDAMMTPGSRATPILAIGGYTGITVPASYDTDEMPFGICFGGLKWSEPKADRNRLCF